MLKESRAKRALFPLESTETPFHEMIRMAKRFRSGSGDDTPAQKTQTPHTQSARASATENADEKNGQEKPPPPAWRSGVDFIVMLACAVVAALAIKAYVFDVYLIPSGSMETALHGRPDGGDRIFCSKLNYRVRPPKRWEVAVFEFPYESARRSDVYNISAQYKGQNFVKRVVGLPGESLAISRGDIWVRSAGGEYERAGKPDSVQRGMWLKVFKEDFSDISLNEFETFWKFVGGEAILRRGGPLRLDARSEAVRLDYRPLAPAGERREAMVELPGVPDRYVLEQPVQFRCRGKLPGGENCAHLFTRTIETQNIMGRCPRCETMCDERSVVFYHRRSGLPATGRYGVNPRYASQGEEVAPRQAEYHLVPDLRIVADVTLSQGASVALTLREDARYAQAVVHSDGRVEVLANGEAARPEWRAVTAIRPGEKHTIEFYVVDGTARLFVDGGGEAVLDGAFWRDSRVMPRNLPRASGVSVTALGGEVTVAGLAIDRDVFYYSGWEQERGERFGQMSSSGEVFVNGESFFPMGDHCTSSFDARSWGPVPLSLLRGPALFIWWPPERIGRIPAP